MNKYISFFVLFCFVFGGMGFELRTLCFPRKERRERERERKEGRKKEKSERGNQCMKRLNGHSNQLEYLTSLRFRLQRNGKT
jgi:hypothetical protein